MVSAHSRRVSHYYVVEDLSMGQLYPYSGEETMYKKYSKSYDGSELMENASSLFIVAKGLINCMNMKKGAKRHIFIKIEQFKYIT